MKLREFLSGNKNEYIWSLVVEPGWVQAGIWTIDGEEATVVSTSHPVAWETPEELEKSADGALSSAVAVLPDDANDPNKVVFGVPASWISEGQIRKDHLELLRGLCKKLTLSPSGFVTLPEALSFYIKSVEGSPLSAVVLSPGKEMLEVSIFRLGNLVGTTQVARSVSLYDDAVEALSRFNSPEALPSRFIIFGGKEGDLAEAKQSLLGGSWENIPKVKLMHAPKVETMGGDKKVEAVSLGGASEIAKVTKIKFLEKSEAEVPDEAPVKEVPSEAEAEGENFGFVVNRDIKDAPEEETLEEAIEKSKPKSPLLKGKATLSRFSGLAGRLGPLKKLILGGRKPVVIGLVTIVVLGSAFISAWWFYPKSTVTVFISPQQLEEKVSVFADKNSNSLDFGAKTLPGRVINAEISGETTTETTGTKLVGEKASGEVEIRNSTADDLDLSSGTSLVSSSNSLEFVLSEGVVVPAQTAPGDPGKAKVKVAAGSIGSEYNLTQDSTFKVSSYPKATVDAVATVDFSGGTSNQIRAVSEEDRARVLEDLTNQLTEKIKDNLSSAVNSDEFFIDGSTTVTAGDKNYSAKAGDEADSLTLSLSLSAEGVAVSKEDLFNLAGQTLQSRIPMGYILRETQLNYDFELVEEKDGKYELSGNITANLLPEINTDEIAREIAGKFPTLAQDYLRNIPGFSRAEISISPRFPGQLGTLPHVAKNISVEVAADK